MELSHTLTAVVMSEVDSPQLTENAVYGWFWWAASAQPGAGKRPN